MDSDLNDLTAAVDGNRGDGGGRDYWNILWVLSEIEGFGFVICRVVSCCWQDRPAVEKPPRSAFCRGSSTSGSRSGQTTVAWSHTVAVSMVRVRRPYVYSFHRFQLSPSLSLCLFFFCQSLEQMAYPAAPSRHNSKTFYSELINTTGWRL